MFEIYYFSSSLFLFWQVAWIVVCVSRMKSGKNNPSVTTLHLKAAVASLQTGHCSDTVCTEHLGPVIQSVAWEIIGYRHISCSDTICYKLMWYHDFWSIQLEVKFCDPSTLESLYWTVVKHSHYAAVKYPKVNCFETLRLCRSETVRSELESCGTIIDCSKMLWITPFIVQWHSL